MKSVCTLAVAWIVLQSLIGVASAQAAASPPSIPAWPRTFQKDSSTILMYQPQVDSWKDNATIRFRAAVAVTQAGVAPQYGVVSVKADTLVDDDARSVLMTNLDVAVRFPSLADAKAAPLKALTKECLQGLSFLDISLDQVLSHLHSTVKVTGVKVNLDPPPIFYSDVPAILVTYMGSPEFKPIKDTKLMFAVNTNWVVLMDMNTSQYYLLVGDGWLTSPDPMKGPWTAAASLPASLSALPDGGNWTDVKKQIPGVTLKSVPRVITSVEPAELIVTSGPPDFSPIDGTRLMYVSNPETPLFLDLVDSNYYFLVAGRWFRSGNVNGPWTAASTDLPAEFAKIPPSSPVGFVLASVPHTQQAQDAILLAQVPHKATVKISEAKVDVTYAGTPKFVPIQGTTMTYATNTPFEVVFAAGNYYCCYQGVWFMAPAQAGPWVVCTSVPPVIYTIPPSSPVYNVTYVQVYSSTPDVVVVGYTAGYSGEYVAATGALMFGAGMLTGALLANNDNYYYGCCPCYYSYGCAAHYSYAYGGYYRAGGSYYGPHGGAGWGSSYNPATGTFSRSGYAYGPNGAVHGSQAYNPFTNTYSAHAGGTNGYQSWGASTVSRGSDWASAAHESGVRGSEGWAENSSGQWAEGAHSNVTNSSVAKTSNGDIYAGHDGNVYKKSDGSWQKYSGDGNWQDSSWNKPAAPRQTVSSADTESSWQNSMKSNASSGGFSSAADDSNWKSNFESGSSGGLGGGDSDRGWGQSATQSGLNQDSWARNQGNSNTGLFSGGSGGGGGLFGGSSGGGFASRFGGGGGDGGGWGSRFGGGGGGGGRFRR